MNFSQIFLGILFYLWTVFADDRPKVDYYLFTKESPKNSTTLTTRNAHLLKDAEQIVFVVHGWTQDSKTGLFVDLKDAYLSRNDTKYHVVVVDWSSISKLPYTIACFKAPSLGKTIAQFILNITKTHNLRLDKFELNGHSLGSQVVAFVGQEIRESSGSKLGRLTGLDPAGPGYVLKPEHDRLSPDDADVVVVIHTDGLALGYFQACGSVDVYVNTGKALQPGCPDDILHAAECSHHRSVKYYIEALKSGKFHALKCDSYSHFHDGKCSKNKKINIGRNITKEDHGSFYVDTNSKPPYSKE